MKGPFSIGGKKSTPGVSSRCRFFDVSGLCVGSLIEDYIHRARACTFVSSVCIEHNCFVALSEMVTVPLNSQMCLPAKIMGRKSASGVLVVELCKEVIHTYGRLVAHSITDAVADHTMVQVMNPCFAPATVHENIRVDILHPIVDCTKVQPVRSGLDLSRV